MKVLHLIDSAGLYGAEKVMLALAVEQARRGMRVIIGSIAAPGVEKDIDAAARSSGLDVRRIELRPGLNWGSVRALGRWLESEPCDVVHSHGYKPNVLMGLQARRKGRPAHVITLHGWTATGHRNMNVLYEWLDRALLRRADAIVIVSERMRGRYRNRFIRKARHVPNGIGQIPGTTVPIDTIIRKFCDEAPTVVCVGRLVPEKDYLTVLNALALTATTPALRLLIIGDGPLRAALEGQSRDLGLSQRVLFTGYMDEAWRVFPLCRAMIISSITEGLPIALLEAMRGGLPVIATPVGDIKFATDGDEGAWYFPVGNQIMLTRLLETVARGGDEVARRVASAKARCQSVFSLGRNADAYSALYAETLKSIPMSASR
jgi:glycosyltransferase involved in cell wall biosynthesis